MSDDMQHLREVANRARHHACTSAHKRGSREVVIIDRDDLDVLAAYTEAFADGVERARARRARWQERDGGHELVFEGRVIARVVPSGGDPPWLWRVSEQRRAVSLGCSHHGGSYSPEAGKLEIARVLRNAAKRRRKHG